jgi:hypothetical protein
MKRVRASPKMAIDLLDVKKKMAQNSSTMLICYQLNSFVYSQTYCSNIRLFKQPIQKVTYVNLEVACSEIQSTVLKPYKQFNFK